METMRFGVNAPDVMHETIDGEVIVIHLVSGNYYSLRETAAHIWALVENRALIGVEEIVDALAVRYASPRSEIENAVTRFVSELAEEGLSREWRPRTVPARPRGRQPNGVSKLPFEPPRVEKYTDMQDLVLLDPVHQVTTPVGRGNARRRPECVTSQKAPDIAE